MNTSDLISLAPLWIVGGTAVAGMVLTGIKRNFRWLFVLSVCGVGAALFSLQQMKVVLPHAVNDLLVVDRFAVFSMALILGTSLAILLLSYDYFAQREERKEEFYLLFLLAILGALVLVTARHFMTFFLGLETLSISLYGLIAYLRAREPSDEAGIKYLILAAAASAFLLMGMAFVYAACGKMSFPAIGYGLQHVTAGAEWMVITGFAFMLVGIGFKMGVVPFHQWVADVYQGAPAPVTAFIATVSKGGIVVVLIRFFHDVNGYGYTLWVSFLAGIAVASMLLGNLLALQQHYLKRLLAYSSIAHMGYLLVALLAGGSTALEAVAFYLVAYFITLIAAFAVVVALSSKEHDADLLEEYRGLFWSYPWLALVLTAAMLSLAGIPLTAGFIGKFYIFTAGVGASYWILLLVLVLSSVIGLFYYIRVIAMMFSLKGNMQVQHPLVVVPLAGVVVLVLGFLGLLLLGMDPSLLVRWLREAVLLAFH